MTNAYITNSGSTTVSVVDTSTNTVTATITVGTSPYGVAVTPDGSQAYITNSGTNTVSVINTSANTVTATITVGTGPTAVAVTPDGSKAYVANSPGVFSVINTSTNTVTGTITGIDASGIAITPDGSTAYVSTPGTGDFVRVISLATNTISTSIAVGHYPVGVAITPDGTQAYVANFNPGGSGSVSVIDIPTNTVSTTISVANFPHSVAVTPDGSKAYVVSSAGTVSVINTSTNTVTTTITVGTDPRGISITPDGSTAYVANQMDGTVSVINVSTNTVTTTVTVGSNPVGFGQFIQPFNQPIPPGYDYGFGGFVNKFRNPVMDIWQRGTSGTITGGTPAYTADGWIVGCTGGNVGWAQGPIGFGSYYYLKVTGATGVTDTYVRQRIESSVASQIYYGSSAFNITVQASIYNVTGASITPTLTVRHAGSLDNWSSPVTDVNAVALQPCPNGAETTVAYTFTPGSASYNGMEITFDFGTALNSSSNYILFWDTDIRLTPGVTAGLNNSPAFRETRPISAEIDICKRYYQKSFPQMTTPAQNAGVAGALCVKNPIASGEPSAYVQFSPPMRTTPTFTTYNPSAANANWRNVTAGADVTVSVDPASAMNDSGVLVAASGTVTTLGNILAIHWTANADL